MSDDLRPGDNLFWNFSRDLYGDVESECLALQNEQGLNVNLLLYCLWAGRQGRRLERADFEALQEAIRPWEANVIQPLRGVRNWLKVQDLAPQDFALKLRGGVLSQELLGEAAEQWLICQAVPIESGSLDPGTGAANLLSYMESAGAELGADMRQRLVVLLTAAFPGLDETAATLNLRFSQ